MPFNKFMAEGANEDKITCTSETLLKKYNININKKPIKDSSPTNRSGSVSKDSNKEKQEREGLVIDY